MAFSSRHSLGNRNPLSLPLGIFLGIGLLFSQVARASEGFTHNHCCQLEKNYTESCHHPNLSHEGDTLDDTRDKLRGYVTAVKASKASVKASKASVKASKAFKDGIDLQFEKKDAFDAFQKSLLQIPNEGRRPEDMRADLIRAENLLRSVKDHDANRDARVVALWKNCIDRRVEFYRKCGPETNYRRDIYPEVQREKVSIAKAEENRSKNNSHDNAATFFEGKVLGPKDDVLALTDSNMELVWDILQRKRAAAGPLWRILQLVRFVVETRINQEKSGPDPVEERVASGADVQQGCAPSADHPADVTNDFTLEEELLRPLRKDLESSRGEEIWVRVAKLSDLKKKAEKTLHAVLSTLRHDSEAHRFLRSLEKETADQEDILLEEVVATNEGKPALSVPDLSVPPRYLRGAPKAKTMQLSRIEKGQRENPRHPAEYVEMMEFMKLFTEHFQPLLVMSVRTSDPVVFAQNIVKLQAAFRQWLETISDSENSEQFGKRVRLLLRVFDHAVEEKRFSEKDIKKAVQKKHFNDTKKIRKLSEACKQILIDVGRARTGGVEFLKTYGDLALEPGMVFVEKFFLESRPSFLESRGKVLTDSEKQALEGVLKWMRKCEALVLEEKETRHAVEVTREKCNHWEEKKFSLAKEFEDEIRIFLKQLKGLRIENIRDFLKN